MKKVLFVANIAVLAGCAQTPTPQQLEVQTRSIEQLQSHYLELVSTLHRMENDIHAKSSQIDSLNVQINRLSQQIEDQHQQENEQSDTDIEPLIVEVEEPMETNTAVVTTNRDVITLGAVERISLRGVEQSFDARVDTGATTSSIDAQNIKEFERNGKKWVKFHISDLVDEQGELLWLEVPVLRYANVRQVNSEEAQKRPVVLLTMQLGELREKVEFTLTDRSQMVHSVLLGREFLKDIALVDVSREYVQSKSES